MRNKAYVLLDVVEGKAEEVARSLEGRRGVLDVDVLANKFGVMMVLEADGHQNLVELTVEALKSVEAMTDGLVVLPVMDYAMPFKSLNREPFSA